MSENRGIFSLEEFYDLQVAGETTNVFEVFRYVSSIGTPSPLGTDYGYFGGGTYNSGGNSSSIIQRIDFNNDTANSVTKGNETVTAQNRGGTSSTSYGYLGGGNDPAYVSTVDRIDYSNDATTASPKGPITLARARASGTHNSDYGYQGGGYAPASPNYISTVDRIDFSNDTATAVAKGPLTGPKNATIAVGNQSYGYWAAGSFTPWPTFYTSVDRLDYSSDTTATAPKGNLTRARAYTGGAGNASYGYIGAGYFDPGPYTGSTMDRIDYSNDTAAAVPAGPYLKSSNSWNLGATGNTSYGYWAGDERNADGSEIGRLDYSNDTQTTTQVASLSGYMQRICGFSSRANANPTSILPSPVPATRSESGLVAGGNDFGYNAGGRTPGSTDWTNVDRLDFANDTNTMATKGPLSIKRSYAAALTSVTHGYAAGNFASNTGHPSPGPTVEKIDYANDTAVGTITALMASYGYYRSGSSNKSYGWVSGGPAWNGVTTVERLDWSNDSATSSPRGNLNVSRHHPMAVGNMSYGYHYGGQNGPSSPSYLSSVSRIDYSNDSATASPKGPLTAVTTRAATTGAGNADYGYADKIGDINSTTLNRIDYSNDTATALPKGTKSTSPNNYLNCTVSNSEYGWWIGGYASPSSSIVMRITFANDTAAAQPKGNTSFGRGYTTCHSARMHGFTTGYVPGTKTVDRGAEGYQVAGPLGPAYGYWIGGSGGGSQYNRVDFSNDTGTAGVRGNLDRSVDRNVAVSSMNYAYVAGGFSNTNISRIDYADDTATATPKGNLLPISGLSSPAGVDTINYGYICGGLSYTRVDRIDYSNDTAVASARGPLTATRRYISASGNSSYGYIAGGTPAPGYMSSVDRIDYADDTATATPKGPLPYVLLGYGMTGNADYGYVNGGFNAVPGSNNWISSVNRIDYANDTATAAPKGPLTQARRTKSTGSPTYGWSGGGSTSGHAGTSTMDRIDYANDTATASARGSLNGTRTNHYAAGAQANAKQGAPTFIPRIRWVDSAAEVSAVTEGPAFGYFAGGYTGSRHTTMDRIDYSNDTPTATPKGPITIARNTGSATSNHSHGYFAGGYDGSDNLSRVDRVDYSNDTPTATAKGNLEDGRTGAGGAGNVNFGYVAGGRLESSGSESSQIDRIDYSNDTATALEKGNLLNNKYYYQGGVGNQDFGYFGGGRYPSPSGHSRVERIEYANDTATTVAKGPLSFVKHKIAATGTPAYGYFAGGGPTPYNTTVDRIDYANDTATASPKSTITQGRNSLAAVSSNSHGYFGGGATPSYISTVDKIDFSNDTATATTVGTLSAGKSSVFATSSRNDALPSTVRAAIAAPVQPPFPLPVQLAIPAANYGYIMGGSGDPSLNPSYNHPAQRIDLLNDTVTAAVRAAPGAPSHYYSNATGNKNYAWSSMGGFSSSCSVLRLDYSNDTATMLSRGQRATALVGASGPTPSVGGYEECAVGNLDYGYWCGGGKNYSVPADPSTCSNGYIQGFSHIDRLDYSNDTANTLRRSYNTTRTGNGDGCGTNTYGYFVGGGDNPCNGGDTSTVIERLDYSADTNNSVVKGNLTNAVWRNSAVGNNDYGYSVGGSPSSNSTYVQRIDYSNDTATTAPKGNLTVTRSAPPSTGSQSHGYVTGGSANDVWTSVERITYANDTAAATPRGPLTYKTYYSGGASATENSNHL